MDWLIGWYCIRPIQQHIDTKRCDDRFYDFLLFSMLNCGDDCLRYFAPMVSRISQFSYSTIGLYNVFYPAAQPIWFLPISWY